MGTKILLFSCFYGRIAPVILENISVLLQFTPVNLPAVLSYQVADNSFVIALEKTRIKAYKATK